MPLRKATRVTLEGLIPKLARYIKLRKIRQAMKIVDEYIDQLETLPLTEKGAFALLGYCAWAIDFYAPHITQVERAVARFKQLPKRDLTLGDLSHLNIAEGLLAFHHEAYDEAEHLFDKAQKYANDAEDTELMIVTRYYLARALWKRVEYAKALEYINEAITREDPDNRARLTAMELLQAWLIFLQGGIKEAQRVLDNAKSRLSEQTDAWIDLGNICSFQGRIYREDGKYLDALKSFSAAIRYYRTQDRGHRNVARSRFNKGFVYRILARDISWQPVLIDQQRLTEAKKERLRREAKVERLRRKAFTELKLAREIYEFDPNRHARGLGRVHSILALLYFDSYEFDKAEAEAKTTYDYGRQKGDKMIIADARVIQSTLALEKGELYRALEFAKQAVRLSEQTNNRRLRARAYIRMGLAMLELNKPQKAQECSDEARANLVDADRDYLRASFAKLEKGIREKLASSTVIREIRDTEIEGEPLKEYMAEVEEDIIQLVYERCGRKISKTARKLKTTPREVREAVSTFKITERCLENLKASRMDEAVLEKLAALKNWEIQGRAEFVNLLIKTINLDQARKLKTEILKHVAKFSPPS